LKYLFTIFLLLPTLCFSQQSEEITDTLLNQSGQNEVIDDILQTPDQVTDSLAGQLSVINEVDDSLHSTVQKIGQVEDTLQATVNSVQNITDTIPFVNKLLANRLDTLESVQRIAEIETWKKKFLDSLSLFDLPEELKNYVDSLRDLTRFEDRLKDKLKKVNPADTLDSPVLSQVSEMLEGEGSELEKELMPDEFYDKLDQYKGDLEQNGLYSDVTSFLDHQTDEYTDLTSKIDLDGLIKTDLGVLKKLDMTQWSGELGKYSSKIGEYTGELDKYVQPDQLKGIGGKNLNPDEYSDLLAKMDSEDFDKLVQDYGSLSESEFDKRIEEQLSKMSEVQEFKQQSSTVDKLKSDQITKMEEIRKYQDLTSKIAQKKERVLANEVIEENFDIVEEAQKVSDKLLNKYVKIENSNDLETGTKRYAEDKSFWKRWVYGGNFQLNPGENISLDLSPFLAYKFNKLFLTGIGTTFRYEFKKEEHYLPDMDRQPEFGYRFFSQFKMIKGFYVHGEWERLSIYNDNEQKLWVNNYLAGIGRQINIKDKAAFTISILYNFNHKKNDSYDRPFMLRMGFQKR